MEFFYFIFYIFFICIIFVSCFAFFLCQSYILILTSVSFTFLWKCKIYKRLYFICHCLFKFLYIHFFLTVMRITCHISASVYLFGYKISKIWVVLSIENGLVKQSAPGLSHRAALSLFLRCFLRNLDTYSSAWYIKHVLETNHELIQLLEVRLMKAKQIRNVCLLYIF